MTLVVAAWIGFAAFLLAVGVRTTLTEAWWRSYRVETGPRRVVRGLDALIVVLVVGQVAALAAVIGPTVLSR